MNATLREVKKSKCLVKKYKWATQEQWGIEDFDQTDLAKFPLVHYSSSYHNVVIYGDSFLLGAGPLSKFFSGS